MRGSAPPENLHTFRVPVNLAIHVEARRKDEEWSGRANATTRRKLQNRLNQRAHRRRVAEEKASRLQIFEIVIPEMEDYGRESRAGSDTQTPPLELPNWSKTALSPTSSASASWCRRLEPLLIRKGFTEPLSPRSSPSTFEETFLPYLSQSDLHRLPTSDHVLSLTYYNVFRALTHNVNLLSLSTTRMHTEGYPSPFNPNSINHFASLNHVPPNLRPTKLQLSTPHHPCFDIFPCPIVRDNGITHTSILPHGKLCMTLAGRSTWFEREPGSRSGLVVWGPPEDTGSWEVTEGFVKSWGWLVRGSHGLEESTNYWRGKRGEGRIFFA